MLAAQDVRWRSGYLMAAACVVLLAVWSVILISDYNREDGRVLRIESSQPRHDDIPENDSTKIYTGDTSPKQNRKPDMTDDPAPTQISDVIEDVKRETGLPDIPEYCDTVVSLLRGEMLPDWMAYVAWRESRCSPGAKRLLTRTGDQSFGYFQINTLDNLWPEVQRLCGVTARHTLLDPEANVRCAAEMYRRYGYKPWNSGVYFKAP